ncbi:MAG: MFS transporter [Paracoccaceae bacterium]|nr:MFS transporter [Paracoccaceae bacterium]
MTRLSEAPWYRWAVVLASALILALALGSIVNGMSAFIVPMEEAFGWSRAEISLINVVGIIGLAIGGLFMGALADRLGTRPVVLFGVTVVGTCYFFAAFAEALWQYYALMFVAGFFGAAAIFPTIMAALGNWFPVGAGLAIGIASAGQALGQGGVPFLSAILIQSYGISATFAITGAAMLLLLLPLALLHARPPERIAEMASTNTAQGAGYHDFKVFVPTMCLAVLLCCTCMSIPLMHLVPLIQDRGFAPEEASGVIFLMLMVAVVGRFSFGKLADTIGPLPAYMTATAWMTVMVYGFMLIETLPGLTWYAMIYGFGYAGVMTGILVSVAMLTHPSHRALAMGIVTMFGWFGHANGGFLGGLLFDLTGDYQITYATAAASGILNLMIVGTYFSRTRGGTPAATAV